jgi:hypothetical protein
MQTRVSNFNQRLGSVQETLSNFNASIGSWLTGIAIFTTVILVWVVFSQAVLIFFGWRYFSGQEPFLQTHTE